MDDMKDALDRAASSPDPAVRNMAIRYRETQQELANYEGFFAIYKQGVKTNGVAPVTRPAAATRSTTAKAPSMSRSDRNDTFSTSMKNILTQNGQPMKLNEVHAAYQAQHPEDPTSKETFRQRLVKRRDIITLVPHQGYLWIDEQPKSEVSENA